MLEARTWRLGTTKELEFTIDIWADEGKTTLKVDDLTGWTVRLRFSPITDPSLAAFEYRSGVDDELVIEDAAARTVVYKLDKAPGLPATFPLNVTTEWRVACSIEKDDEVEDWGDARWTYEVAGVGAYTPLS